MVKIIKKSKQVINMADEGIKVYTIGVGTETGGRIPLKINGSLIGYKKDRKGETVITQRKPDVLQEIAQSSEGVILMGTRRINL